MATSDGGGDDAADGAYDNDQVMRPGFRLANGTHEGRPCRNLYLQTFEKVVAHQAVWISRAPEQWHHLATITSDKLAMRPIFTNPHAKRYLSRRHGRITTVVYSDGFDQGLPTTADEAVGQIEMRLPHRMFNNCEYGLGFIKELDLFWLSVTRGVAGVHTLVISDGGDPTLNGVTLTVSEQEVAALRRRFERIKRAGREKTTLAARWIVRNDLLPRVDPQRFPRMAVEPAGTHMVELLREGAPSVAASRRARRSSVAAIRQSLPALAQEEPREVLELHAEIERVTLQHMIARFDEMLQEANTQEPRWQRFFEDNIFILKLVFARPVRLLHTQFHAQGSGASGAGAQIGDFLFAEQGQALAIVEIKKPGTELLGGRYRNKQVFGASAELSGAITQVLVQQNEMRVRWQTHQYDDPLFRDSRSDVIRCIVIAGRTPTEDAHRRSFDIIRNACKDVDVITFDELLGKLRLLQQHLGSPPPEPASAA